MSDITPTDKQYEIIKDIISWYKGGRNTPQVYYLAGYAGTGKSTIAKFVIEALSSSATFKAIPAAYTGKAANVLRQRGNPDAMTFHSGMYIPRQKDNGEVTFHLDPNAPFSAADLILGDECSMINEYMATDAQSFGKKVLVMGDPGQLKPIQGYGYWINRKPDAFLVDVHRQALNSPILRLATLSRRGKELPVGSWTDENGNKIRVIEYDRDQEHHMINPNTQAICGTHKHRKYFTQLHRESNGFEGEFPQAGERLICIKNDKTIGIYNGCFGTLLSNPVRINRSDNILLDIQMEDLALPLRALKTNPYAFKDHFVDTPKPLKHQKGVQEFDWGYVITCHKAQGSEWEHVTVLDDSAIFREQKNAWAYTAITRAVSGLTFLKRTYS